MPTCRCTDGGHVNHPDGPCNAPVKTDGTRCRQCENEIAAKMEWQPKSNDPRTGMT